MVATATAELPVGYANFVVDDGFLTDLRTVRVGTNAWDLESDLEYEGTHEVFIAHAGYRTDFASVPRLVQSLVPRTGPWDKAAVMHDVFCTDLRRWYDELEVLLAHGIRASVALSMVDPPMVNAVDADGLFRQMMRRGGVGTVTRWLMWTAVRWAALRNPARRARWWRTAHQVLPITLLVLLTAAALAVGWGLFIAWALTPLL